MHPQLEELKNAFMEEKPEQSKAALHADLINVYNGVVGSRGLMNYVSTSLSTQYHRPTMVDLFAKELVKLATTYGEAMSYEKNGLGPDELIVGYNPAVYATVFGTHRSDRKSTVKREPIVFPELRLSYNDEYQMWMKLLGPVKMIDTLAIVSHIC